MGLADMFDEKPAAKRPEVQTYKRSPVAAPEKKDVPTPRRLDAQPPKKLAKSLDPLYTKKTLYVQTEVVDDAMLRYKREYSGKEESELVDRLLGEFVKGGFRG